MSGDIHGECRAEIDSLRAALVVAQTYAKALEVSATVLREEKESRESTIETQRGLMQTLRLMNTNQAQTIAEMTEDLAKLRQS